MSRFQQVRDQWDRDVQELAADMVEAGTDPGEALVEASKRVSHQRRSKIESDAQRLLESIGKGQV